MKRLFGKELDVKKIWKNLNTNQRFSLSVLVFLLISFPVSLLLSLSPVRLFSRAQLPSTPPISITPTPTYPNTISWKTPSVELEALHFEILTGGDRYQAIVDRINIHSDPGSPTYTTLEAIWHEKGVEMRMFMYFKADGNNWRLDELRTYNGLNPGGWIFYEVGWERQSLMVKGRLGIPFVGDVKLYSRSDQVYRGTVRLDGLHLLPFVNITGPTPTFTVTPTRKLTSTPTVGPTLTPTIAVTPTPSAIPSFTTRYLKPGMSGRKYKTQIRGLDKDRDKLEINATGLPRGVELKDCKTTYSRNVSRITCDISGVPLMSGFYRTQFELRDDSGAGTTANYTLIVFPKFLP